MLYQKVKNCCVVALVIMFDVLLIWKHNKAIHFSLKCKFNYFAGVVNSICRHTFPMLSQRIVVVKWLHIVQFNRSMFYVVTALPIMKYRNISRLYSTRDRTELAHRTVWNMLVLRIKQSTSNCPSWCYSMLRYTKAFIPVMKFVKIVLLAIVYALHSEYSLLVEVIIFFSGIVWTPFPP